MPVITISRTFGSGGSEVAARVADALGWTLLDNALNLLGLSHFVIMIVKGALILFAALLDVGRHSWFQGSGA